MQRWCLAVAVALAGCGDHRPAADASIPPASLVAVNHAMVGMVVSEPAGIRCGTCQRPQTRGVPCPPGPVTDRTCSHDFALGTEVTLSLVGEDVYTDFVCASQEDHTVTGCSFVIAAPVTVGVWGEVPAQ